MRTQEEIKLRADKVRTIIGLTGLTPTKLFLVGSQVQGFDTDSSDWDFVIQFDDTDPSINFDQAPMGRLFTPEGRIHYLSRQSSVSPGEVVFHGVTYNLSFYDVDADILTVGPDDAAYREARAKVQASYTQPK